MRLTVAEVVRPSVHDVARLNIGSLHVCIPIAASVFDALRV